MYDTVTPTYSFEFGLRPAVNGGTSITIRLSREHPDVTDDAVAQAIDHIGGT